MLIEPRKDLSWVRKQMYLKSPTVFICQTGGGPHVWIPLTHNPHPVWLLDNWKHTVEYWLKRNEMIGLNYSVWLPCDLHATVECIFVENSIHLCNVSAPSCDSSGQFDEEEIKAPCVYFQFLSRVLGEGCCSGIIIFSCKEKLKSWK